ncbi:MAG: response regulator transcription factor [Monoglobales bacterium]
MKRNILLIIENQETYKIWVDGFKNQDIELYNAVPVEDALDLYEKREYCIVIMEIFLKHIDGLELLTIIRQKRSVPILVLASKEDNTEKIRAIKAGANCYLTEPYCWKECFAYANSLINLYMDIQKRSADKILTFGTDLVINPQSHQALLNGVNLQLTRIEFDLLYCLASHMGRVLSREQLYDLVWKEHSAYHVDEVVKAHIKALRRKLEKSNIEYIKNVWGIGYQFLLEIKEP